MKRKQPKITYTMQKVAVDILEDLEAMMMCSDRFETKEQVLDEVFNVFKRAKDKYELCEDPFTQTICTTKEFFKNHHEMERQLMIERYGHCDGLD